MHYTYKKNLTFFFIWHLVFDLLTNMVSDINISIIYCPLHYTFLYITRT